MPVLRQIDPSRVAGEDEGQLAGAVPVFELRFALDCVADVLEVLEIDEAVGVVLGSVGAETVGLCSATRRRRLLVMPM